MFVFLTSWAIFSTVCSVFSAGARSSIRIVDEPVSYGIGNDLIQAGVREVRSVPRFRPANFSGPRQLKSLKGQCFDLESEKYRYALCPFDNVTQSSVNHWPSQHTVLGIWRGWEIRNNTFHAMLMSGGDPCGKENREVKVTMSCNGSEAIASVAEPKKCRYEMHLWTRLVCHPQSMLVYPRLPGFLRDEWDELYTRYLSERVTEKGYEDGLSRIFVRAGFYSPAPSDASPATESATETRLYGSSFESLPRCRSEYEKLRKELDSLKLLLALNEFPGEEDDAKA